MTISHIITALMLSVFSLSASAQVQPVKPFDPASLDQIVASHRGKPFLLFVWSMDCEFCQASLEVLAKARAADPTLEVVSLTTDPVADAMLTEQVRARLASLALLRNAWGFGNHSPERLRYAVDPAWRGEKPRSYWYDAAGRRTAYSGMIKAAKLAQWNKSLRTKPAPSATTKRLPAQG